MNFSFPREGYMAKTVADQFMEILAAAGVKRIYGVVGDSLNGLTDSLRRQGKIEWVHVRHEEVAAFAAKCHANIMGWGGNLGLGCRRPGGLAVNASLRCRHRISTRRTNEAHEVSRRYGRSHAG